jgi:hypothetical protein
MRFFYGEEINKLEKKLYLFKGRRVTLLKKHLSSISTYLISLFNSAISGLISWQNTMGFSMRRYWE